MVKTPYLISYGEEKKFYNIARRWTTGQLGNTAPKSLFVENWKSSSQLNASENAVSTKNARLSRIYTDDLTGKSHVRMEQIVYFLYHTSSGKVSYIMLVFLYKFYRTDILAK